MKLDERGKRCPRLVIDARKALGSCNPGEAVEILVDNGIAVQDLSRMTASKGLSAASGRVSDNEFSVKVVVGQGVTPTSGAVDDSGEEPVACQPGSRKKDMTVVLSSNLMGHGDLELEKALMKRFVYTFTQQDTPPKTILLYNSGAYLSYEGSDNLENLRSLESQGAEIPTYGTCLNFYGLSRRPQVGSVTNMCEIVERMTTSKLLVRP